jgi:hypothetical protein
LDAVTKNPAKLLGRPEPILAAGEPASFIIFRRPTRDGFMLRSACIGGDWHECTS